jgi:hypothetical protein
MRTSTTKRQPGENGRKLKKLELDKKSLKDLVARDPGRVKGGQPFTIILYTCK